MSGRGRRAGAAAGGLLIALAIALPARALQVDGDPGVPASTTQDAAAAGKAAHGQGLFASLHDPQDGKFDVSRWLLEHKGGFLPVPIIITDPAVGKGGGIALAFFHRPEGSPATRTDADGRQRLIAPNIYGAMVARTSNGTEAYGVGASMHFAEDRWRYRGGVAKASINLDFHAAGGRLLPPREIAYNADGVMSFQQVFRRIGGRDLFAGLAWIYMDLDVSFDSDSDRQYFADHELASRNSGLGLSLEYDSRNNPFTPSRGWLGMVEGNFYDRAIGSDNDFQSYRGHVYGYWPLGRRFVLGARGDVRVANGDIPFYQLPYIDLRGIGSARYQDTRAATVETELRWNLDQRWALLGFAGAGRTWGRHNDAGDGASRVARGVGFRYLLARQLGLYAGIDYAWGPEDDTFYIQVGSAWR